MKKYVEYKKAICYSGYRTGQSPKTNIVPSKEEIREDLHILAKEGFEYIRMYDPNDHARRALEVIKEDKLNMKVMLGVDNFPEYNNPDCPFEKQERSDEELAANAKRNDEEVLRLIDMVKEFSDEILAVSIGNENTPTWGARNVTPERLMEHAKQLKEATGKPVTFCEGVFEWPHLIELGNYLDFISVHSYPLHYGNTIDEALDVNKENIESVEKLFPDKQVISTEMGWTTMTNSAMKPGQANVQNQERYIRELTKWMDEKQLTVFIFEAFDEPWKGSLPTKSECNWGLYTVDRKRKWNW